MTGRRGAKRGMRRRAVKRRNPAAKAVKKIVPKVKPAKRRPPPCETEWRDDET